MKEVKKSWIAVLSGALLMATLVGVVWARPNGRPQGAGPTRKLTVPAASFIPADEAYNYWNDGTYLLMQSGSGSFTAPVVFPTKKTVTVEKITLYAYDNNSTWAACVWLRRARPTHGDHQNMGQACSTDQSSNDPRSFTDATINPSAVRPGHAPYLWLHIQSSPGLGVYAVRIEYHTGA